MTLSVEYIRSLPGDRECLEALAWLAERVPRYPTGSYTPPLTHNKKNPEPTRFAACTLRLGRKSRTGSGARVTRIDVTDGIEVSSIVGTDVEIVSGFAKRVLCSRFASHLLVTTGLRRHSIEVWLDTVGSGLLELGYSLQPCAGSQGVQFVKIKRGKRTWTLVYAETIFGVSLSTIESLVPPAERLASSSVSLARRVYSATSAAQEFLMANFGVAMHLTAGMTAVKAARRHLPKDFKKWRPTPLLVAMERKGRGYRGGMTYAARYRGPSWRIDVNRQYTHALRTALPWKVAFGAYEDEEHTPHGVFMCRLQLSNMLPYPVGVWSGQGRGFVAATVGRGSYVCILHTSEFPGLLATGATITPAYGYVFTHTFDLSAFVDTIQAIIDTHGKESAKGKLTKPLGNYLYGKLGQNPTRTELLYCLSDPGDEWFPYWDEYGDAHEELWERSNTRHTGSQHVEIAGTITGAARSQTASTWALLSAYGIGIVRCHTDSLTTDTDPTGLIATSGSTVGAWKLEREDIDTVIIGANAYIDGDTAHIAGVTDPTYEMVERLYDGQVVSIAQDVQTPLRSGRRGVVSVQREYGKKQAR